MMDDLRAADVDFLTIGQYLQPTPKHAAVDRFVTPDEFDELRDAGARQGLPDGLGLAADALELSRRRRLRPPARGARAPSPREPGRLSVTRHAERRVVAYTPEQLFELVADVARYPEFLPWCHAGRGSAGARAERRRSPSWRSASGRSTRSSPRASCWRQTRLAARASTPPASKARSVAWSAAGSSIRIPTAALIDFELEFDFRSMPAAADRAPAVRRGGEAHGRGLRGAGQSLYGKPSARPATPTSSTR